jgi:hypothetical protein
MGRSSRAAILALLFHGNHAVLLAIIVIGLVNPELPEAGLACVVAGQQADEFATAVVPTKMIGFSG